MSSQMHTPCPHCAVDNDPGRRYCWRCHTELPYAVGPDGHPIAVPRNQKTSRAEIERLLEQAETIDLDAASRKNAGKTNRAETAPVQAEKPAPEAMFKLWMNRLRNRLSQT